MKSKVLFWILGGLALLLLFTFYDPQIWPFPKCPFKSITGLMCPGCGSQRAIYQTLHGNIGEAMRLNALFLPVVLYALIGGMTASLFPSRWPEVKTKFYGLRAAYVALAVVVLFWIGRNLF